MRQIYSSLLVMGALFMFAGCVTKNSTQSISGEPSSQTEPEGLGVTYTSPSKGVTIVCNRQLPTFLFKKDSIVVTTEARFDLQSVTQKLMKYPSDTVTIVGHTCELGSESYNLEVGLRRAEAVKQYLVSRGIAPERIETQSKGESEPVASNDTELTRKFNRRVEVILHAVD